MKIVVHKDASIQVKTDSDNPDDAGYASKIFVPGDVLDVNQVTKAVLEEIKAGRCPHLVLVDDEEVRRESVAAAASDLRTGDVVVSETVLDSEELEAAQGALEAARTEVVDLGGADVIVSAGA